MARPTVPEVLPLMRAVCQRRGENCCLHLWAARNRDDQNFADYCLRSARAHWHGHDDCIKVATLMAQMTTTQRRKVYSLMSS